MNITGLTVTQLRALAKAHKVSVRKQGGQWAANMTNGEDMSLSVGIASEREALARVLARDESIVRIDPQPGGFCISATSPATK